MCVGIVVVSNIEFIHTWLRGWRMVSVLVVARRRRRGIIISSCKLFKLLISSIFILTLFFIQFGPQDATRSHNGRLSRKRSKGNPTSGLPEW